MAASASDAHTYPIYNARYRVLFPLLDADGDLVTGASTPDSELSQDCGTFADATNEATEIATSSGMYYLDLISTELDTKSTAIIVKSATSGMKTTPIVLYPVRLPVIRTGTAQAGAASTITLDSGASAITDYYEGCFVNITNNSPANALGQARRITAYNGSTKVATVEGTYGTNPSSASTFEILATAESLYVLSDVMSFGGVAGTFASGRPEANATHIAGSAVSASTAQIGVNVVNFGGSAGTFAGGRAEVNTSHLGGTTVDATAGLINANVKQISTDATAADNAELFFDGTGYAGTNNVIPTVTTVTNLTNAPTAGDLTATMKTSVTTAATAATPTAAAVTGAVGSVTGAVGSVTGNVGGNVTGTVGSVVGAVGSVTGNVGGNVTGSVGSLAAQAKTDVKTQVTDGLNVDTYPEPGQEAPPATTTLVKKIGYLYKMFRNKKTQTATTFSLFADDASTVDQKATVSDDATTATRGEIATGP